MSQAGRAHRKANGLRHGGGRSDGHSRGEGRDSGGRPPAGERRSWLRNKWPVLRFVLIFCLGLVLFYAATTTAFFRQRAFPRYLAVNASVCAGILRCFGEQAAAYGKQLASPRFGVEVRRGCEAMEPSALLVAAVIASPVSIRARLVGMVLGTAILALMNLVRIVSLFYVGIHSPRVFEVVHVMGWQPAFILLALAFWVCWARWARGRETTTADASG